MTTGAWHAWILTFAMERSAKNFDTDETSMVVEMLGTAPTLSRPARPTLRWPHGSFKGEHRTVLGCLRPDAYAPPPSGFPEEVATPILSEI